LTHPTTSSADVIISYTQPKHDVIISSYPPRKKMLIKKLLKKEDFFKKIPSFLSAHANKVFFLVYFLITSVFSHPHAPCHQKSSFGQLPSRHK
jgi:hypothetical protein